MNSNERRNFLKQLFSIGGFAFLGCRIKEENKKMTGIPRESAKVVICRDAALRNADGAIIDQRIENLLDKALTTYFDSQDAVAGLGSIIGRNDRVSIKVNCLAGKGLSTEKMLVTALIMKLTALGVKADNIIVWDRLNDDLERAGYELNFGGGVKYLGNDYAGYTEDFYSFGEVGSLLSKVVTEMSDVIINVPVLKDHGIVGVSASMKNMFGAIHNPNKYHPDTGDPYVADVNAIPEIKNKIKLIVCDATRLQYEAGPPYHPKYCEDYNGLIISEDPVALDYEAWKIIEDKRNEHSLKTLKDAGRHPSYIFTAADSAHALGFADDAKIKVIRV
jgi:uncharacterized protein (DUF362 family)